MNRYGFSLIELLVVLAVIAVLLSIAMPVLRLSRSQSQDLVCAANLRQINTAALVYAQEAKTFPHSFSGYMHNPPTGIQGDASFDWQGWWWFDFLAGTIGTDTLPGGLLWCPARKITRGPETDYVLCGNYGVNASICRIASQVIKTEFLGTPLKAANLSAPASTILVTDSGYAIIGWKSLSPDPSMHAFECLTRQNVYYLPGAEVNQSRSIHPNHLTDAISGRHPRNRINLSYADGHVDLTSPEKVSPDFDAQGVPKNYSAWSSVRNR